VLIALSWFDVVSTPIGWCGFVIGMVGSVIGWGIRPPKADSPLGSTPASRDSDGGHPPA
jgi:hypothetical protein